MRHAGVELAVGDSVQIKDHVLTVMDITGNEVTFRLDRIGEGEFDLTPPGGDCNNRPPR